MSEPYRRQAIMSRLDAMCRAVMRLCSHQETPLADFLRNRMSNG